MSCELGWQVDAVEDGRLSPSDASFRRHRRTCDECRGRLDANEKLRATLRALPDRAPAELGLRRVRARVLRDAATRSEGRTRGWALGVAAASLVVCLVAGVLVRRARWGPDAGALAPLALAGSVIPAEGARWLQARAGGLERVSLLDGEIRVVVRKQGPEERFLVVLPDGELEVRGTTFDVIVHAGATKHVHVVEGVVQVRVPDARGRTLTAGQTWDAPATAEAEPATRPSPWVASPASSSPPSSPPSLPPRTTIIARSPPAGSGPSVQAPRPPVSSVSAALDVADDWMPDYEAAMGLYRSGRFAQAAEAFDRFVIAHPGASTLDDALFLQSASLARAGRADAAAVVAEHQIERFPGSFHHKEASILVARAARERSDCERARRALAPWLAKHDADASRELGPCSP